MSEKTRRTLKAKTPRRAESARSEALDCIDFLGCLLEGLEDTLWEGESEIIIAPPVEPAQTMGLHRHLKSVAQVESIDVRVSEEGGVVVGLVLGEPVRLLQILRSSPDVDRIKLTGKHTVSVTLTAHVPQKGE